MVGRTGSGKTTFIQHLGKNELFRTEITDVFGFQKLSCRATEKMQ